MMAKGPLRVMFLTSSLPVGGAETLLANLVRGLDSQRIIPEITCLKERGPLGEELAGSVPVHAGLIQHKYDVMVLPRLCRLFRERRVDAVVTVGCGDKMFWGRLAARWARVPVVASALHSTGWPDAVGRMNRLLTPLTDAFIAVAEDHGKHLVEHEQFPRTKVQVIPNGIDLARFQRNGEHRRACRARWGLRDSIPVVTIVAALRPEKNHARFLRIAAEVLTTRRDTKFMVVGDGPERPRLEALAHQLDIKPSVRFLGSRGDIPEILGASDVFLLTSDNEASPVSILEAMACELPVVASDVGSVHESVKNGLTGYRAKPSDEAEFARRVGELLDDPDLRRRLGQEGRRHVAEHASLAQMIDGYMELLERLYRQRSRAKANRLPEFTGGSDFHLPRTTGNLPQA